jgi:hypothetical protein
LLQLNCPTGKSLKTRPAFSEKIFTTRTNQRSIARVQHPHEGATAQYTRGCGCGRRPTFPAPFMLREEDHASTRTHGVARARSYVSTSLRGALATKQSRAPHAASELLRYRSQ